MHEAFPDILEALIRREDLSRDRSRACFLAIMRGELEPMLIAALLIALKAKGETVEEIVGAAQAMRECSVKVPCAADCIDTCSTGGDGVNTFNVSTVAAIIAAAAGATVAKHGNRSTTRVSGSTDVLEHLGIDIDAPPEMVERCLSEARIGYLNAQRLHPAMRHAGPVRRALRTRTIFNLLGPLTNPAGARRQLLGVSRPEFLEPMARALTELGAEHVWVVHGQDGLCDITVTADTSVIEVRDGEWFRFDVAPEDVGLRRAPLEALLVDAPATSARTILSILEGERGPARDQALMSAGAALVVARRADNLEQGVAHAAEAVDTGAARATLERWREIVPAPGPQEPVS
jgi:anthranilate phosphoribosyltransferase